MSEFEGKVILVTGAAGNIGTAVAQAFAERGASLALLDRDEDRLEGLRERLPGAGRHRCETVNLLDRADVAGAVGRIHDAYGRIDCVANIAGGFTMGPPLHETSSGDWDLMMDLNARSVFHTCAAAVPLLLAGGGGRIVNVSARAALEGKAAMGPYCASKAAVITLTETLAAEHKHANINANCILPGTVDTPQNREAMPDADHDTWVAPAALADVVVFLASEASRAVSGAAIPVYGRS
jgi:NAD(P)-dependent dehydrogenase (short-subunit alcohol dehydrogenase family)